MPFDGSQPLALPTLARGDRGLAQLADALECLALWSDRLEWDFHNTFIPRDNAPPRACAIGLAAMMSPDFARMSGLGDHGIGVSSACAAAQLFFGMPGAAVDRIFFELGAYGVCDWPDVTPAMVAAEIRGYIASQQPMHVRRRNLARRGGRTPPV